jgi:hypothetical protein
MESHTDKPSRGAAIVKIAAAMLAVAAIAPLAGPAAASARTGYRAQRVCGIPRRGFAGCLDMRLISTALTPARLQANAARQAREAAGRAKPAVTYRTPFAGFLTPQALHAAYSLPEETPASSLQTIAVVDAYNDPSAEADLAVYSQQFGLPACTKANGCFRKLDEAGHASPLPATQGGWAVEISLDLDMVHAICPGCRVLLVEANSASYGDLGTAVNTASSAGATEVSNSYGGPEASFYSAFNGPYDHPGVVVTVSSGDCGYLNEACGPANAANFPAASPDVVAVGGTSLAHAGEGWTSTAWSDGGSGCSQAFTAPLWQSTAANFSATGCGSGRSVADVAAVGDPHTGVDIYDSTAQGNGDPTGWDVVGGTSAASPIVAAEFALAGGAHGVEVPASTLYANIAEGAALTDVVAGSNGSCGAATSCNAAAGYDGPTGVGSPLGLGAFTLAGTPAASSLPTISGVAEQGQVLTAGAGEWSGTPTATSLQWEQCNSAGLACAPVAGATGATFTVPAGAVGATVRVQQTAANGAGFGPPAASAPTATVVSNVPVITSFTPASGITGTTVVTITGTALDGTRSVRFGGLAAAFTVLSSTRVEATVPNGAAAEQILLTTASRSARSTARFTPTLSVTAFSPSAAAAGTLVKISGIGFNSGSTVAFNGVPAAGVAFVSSTRLNAVVPAGAGKGPITVTNAGAPAGTVASANAFSGS